MPRRVKQSRLSFRRTKFRSRGRTSRRRVVGGRRKFKGRLHGLVLSGFPKRTTVKLRYTETVELNAPGGGAAFFVVRANGMFDPNFTGTGHQPLGFDQWMLAYTHFTVVGSRMQVRVMSELDGHQVPCAGVILKTAESNTHTSMTTIASVKEHTRLTGSKIFYYGDASSYRQSMVARWSGKKWFGKAFLPGSRDYQGSTSADPVEQAFYTVKLYNIGGNDPAAVNAIVTIDYIAVLTEPKFLGGS